MVGNEESIFFCNVFIFKAMFGVVEPVGTAS